MFFDPGLGLRFPYGAGAYAGPSWLEHLEADLDHEVPLDLHIPSYSGQRRPAPDPFNDGHPTHPGYQQASYPGWPCRQSAQQRPVSAHAYQPRAQPEPEVATVVFLDADGRPVRIVAAPSQSSRHQHRPHTSLAHHAQQLWPGMEHGHAAAPPSQREQLLRQAQAAEGAQPRRQQRRPGQPVAPGQWLDLHRQQLAEALAHQRAQEAARAQRLQQQQRLRQQAQLQPPSSHLDPASDWHPYITRQRSQEPPVSAAGRGRQPAGFWDALAHGAPSMGSQQPRARATHPVQGRPSSGDQWWPQAAAAGAQPDHHRPQEQAWAELLPPRWGWPWQQAPEQHVPAPAPAPATRQHQGRQAPSAGNGIELVWVESDGEDGGDVEVARPDPRQRKSSAQPTSHSRDSSHVHATQPAQQADHPRWDQNGQPWVNRRPGAQPTYDRAGGPRPAPKASASRQEAAIPAKAQQAHREQAGRSQQAPPRSRTSEQSPQQQAAAPWKAVGKRRMTQEEAALKIQTRWRGFRLGSQRSALHKLAQGRKQLRGLQARLADVQTAVHAACSGADLGREAAGPGSVQHSHSLSRAASASLATAAAIATGAAVGPQLHPKLLDTVLEKQLLGLSEQGMRLVLSMDEVQGTRVEVRAIRKRLVQGAMQLIEGVDACKEQLQHCIRAHQDSFAEGHELAQGAHSQADGQADGMPPTVPEEHASSEEEGSPRAPSKDQVEMGDSQPGQDANPLASSSDPYVSAVVKNIFDSIVQAPAA